ncbi:MAG: undecaprenyl/decaprenyl-phosphate alpha-N-acetylglucosaminyl 1-phosphate transferase, partial [Actinomycetota bacterium]
AVNRQGLATADRGHLHHRLIALGHGPRRAVVILCLWTALLSGFALYPALSETNPTLWPFLLAAVALAGFTVVHPRIGRRHDDTPTP